MNSVVNELIEDWTKSLTENKDLEKLWNFFQLYVEEPSQLIIQIKNEWRPYFNVYQIIISPSKIEFDQTDNILAPMLCLRKKHTDLQLEKFEKLNSIEDIMYKIEDFSTILPEFKLENNMEEEVEEED